MTKPGDLESMPVVPGAVPEPVVYVPDTFVPFPENYELPPIKTKPRRPPAPVVQVDVKD